MSPGNTHYDVYDRESDYYRDLEDAISSQKVNNKAEEQISDNLEVHNTNTNDILP